MAWKPLETRPHHVSGARGDSGADASHRTVQGPQNPRMKRATTAGKSGPTAGKKSIANCRQTTNNHHSYRGPPDTDHQQDGRDARQISTEALTDQTVLKDRKLSSHSSSRKPSRSLSQRRGRLDSEDRGDSSITVMMRRSNNSPQCSEDCGDVAG